MDQSSTSPNSSNKDVISPDNETAVTTEKTEECSQIAINDSVSNQNSGLRKMNSLELLGLEDPSDSLEEQNRKLKKTILSMISEREQIEQTHELEISKINTHLRRVEQELIEAKLDIAIKATELEEFTTRRMESPEANGKQTPHESLSVRQFLSKEGIEAILSKEIYTNNDVEGRDSCPELTGRTKSEETVDSDRIRSTSMISTGSDNDISSHRDQGNRIRSPSLLIGSDVMGQINTRNLSNAEYRKWEEDIIPQWHKVSGSQKIRSLVFKGIPSKLRGTIWQKAIGNKIKISMELFEILKKRAQSDPHTKLRLIKEDLHRTFSSLGVFKPEADLTKELKVVLEAYANFRPDIGYVQGMAYLAGMLLFHMDSYSAFCCLCNLMAWDNFHAFYKFRINELQAYFDAFDALLKEKQPKLSKHFQELGLTSDVYLIDWFYTVFSRCFTLDVAARVWDNYFFLGETFLFRVALSVFAILEKELLKADFEETLRLIKQIPNMVDQNSLFKMIDKITIKDSKFEKLYRKKLDPGSDGDSNSEVSSATDDTCPVCEVMNGH
mmetsp:Transcript_22969/g.25979  ORF Transcript_22969/g.25979 Transcript_22969/m.25979 type:complete len:554 (+) Transcript_22969:98-1759(+)